MAGKATIVCPAPELAADLQSAAREVRMEIATPIAKDPLAAATTESDAGHVDAVFLMEAPSADRLASLASSLRGLAVALPGPHPRTRELLSDLGLATVQEADALIALLALETAESSAPHQASIRGLSPVDRDRLDLSGGGDKRYGAYARADDGLFVFEHRKTATLVGRAPALRSALRALRSIPQDPRPSMPTVEGVDPQSVMDVILGPRRVLSDPASKAALESYDLPLPLEELCGSPSRAAAEASRIGFPVRVALASPELRASEHPDLVVHAVDNAARVRDVFRQTMALAKSRAPEARLLGVTVSAATSERALLRVTCRSLASDLVLAEVGFADPHGRASGDRTWALLPTTASGLERILERLAGEPLLLTGPPSERRHVIHSIGDVLLRLAAFVHDWRDEIEEVEIDPLAILIGGDVEVREAKVHVSDAFARSLLAPKGLSNR